MCDPIAERTRVIIPRRLRIVVASCALSGVVLGAPACDGDDPPKRDPDAPNILIVVTDDQRASGTLEVMPVTTAWFGRGGRTFSTAYASTPLCCPARASIFTGLFAHNHGVLSNRQQDTARFDHSTTVQKALSDAGYRTGIYGKFLNGWDLERDPPHFDRWGIFFEVAYYDATWNLDGELRDVKTYSSDFIARQAVDFVRSSEDDDDRPWFLYLAPSSAHVPAVPAARHASAPLPPREPTPSLRETDLSDKLPYLRRHGSGPHPGDVRTLQLRTLMSVDEMVSAVVAELRRSGEERETLAFFLSDNGYQWGEHGYTGKRTPFLESVRIPLMVRWPARVDPGTVDDRIAANVDVAPTIYEAAGVEPSLAVDGRSLLAGRERDRMLLEYWEPRGRQLTDWAAVVDARFRYTEYYGSSGRVTFRELYDLETDPWELESLVGSARGGAEVARYARALAALRDCRAAACP